MDISVRLIAVLHLLMFLNSVICQNLLKNGDFESGDFSGNWFCKGGCTLTHSSEAYTGNHSVMVTVRDADWKSVSQSLDVTSSLMYKMTSWARLINTANNATYQDVKMTLTCKTPSDVSKYMTVGKTPQVLPGEWRQVGGVIRIPEGYHTCSMYVQTAHPAEYYLDTSIVQLVPDDDGWKTKAYERIDLIRKRNVRVKLSSPIKVTIEIQQNKLAFPVGSVVSATHIVDPAYSRYQQVFYENFEWGVLGNKLKWRLMEWTQGNIDYETPLTAMKALLGNGTKARCHCTFWGKDKNVQDWVKQLYGEDLKAAISERIKGVIGATSGMCEHWDVNNENLAGDFYERQTGDVNITMEMFHQIRAVDPKPELYLNDYSIVSGTSSTVAIKDVAMRYQRAGVPVAGIGIQSHLHHFDVQLIKARLDIVAEAGLPIMITEFAVNDMNATTKAQKLDDILTLMFSHPAVKGIVIWGFWDGRIWEPDAALYEGDDVTPNEAGIAYENLFHNEWRSRFTRTLKGKKAYSERAYKGDYTVTVKRNGNVLKSRTFSVLDVDRKVAIRVKRSGKTRISFV